MSEMTTIDKGYRQCIGTLGLYSPLPQTAPQLADGFCAASNWQRGGDGLPLISIREVESVFGMVKSYK